jgi:hypothetical protein
MNALEASLMPAEMKAELRLKYKKAFEVLKNH